MECLVYNKTRFKIVDQCQICNLLKKITPLIKVNSGEVAIHLVGEKQIKELNNKYRHKNKVTDVLSFPMRKGQKIDFAWEKSWGDIFICVPQIKRQAKNYGVSFLEEFNRMLIHGWLHLFGFDHQEKKQAERMFTLQEKIVKKISTYEH